MAAAPVGDVFVSDLPWSNETNGYGPIERDRSNGEAGATDGRTMVIAGTTYARGIGSHAPSSLSVDLSRNCTTFSALVGLDDEVSSGEGEVTFRVYGDGVLLADSGSVRGLEAAKSLTADVTGVQELRLAVAEGPKGKNGAHADWAMAKLSCAATQPGVPTDVSRWDVTGPSATSANAVVRLNSAGEVSVDVRAHDRVVATASSLGLRGNDGDFTSGLTFVERADRVVDESYSMVTGKATERSYRHNESTFTFANKDGAEIDLVVRAGADGVAYRYGIAGAGEHRVDREVGSWTLAQDGRAWMQKSYTPNYESEWTTTTAMEAPGNTGYPALFEQGDSFVLLTESNVHGNYSATHLTHAAGSLKYAIELFEGRAVTSTGALVTPWRVAIVGSLDTVVGSTLVDDLATPSQITDTSWITPGVSSWSWLTDWNSPRDEARQRDFVDLSARMGWKYVLLDEGWDASWVPRTVRYAANKGVDVIAWFHSRDLRTQQQRDEWLPKLASWGVKGLKVDFMDTDSQEIHQWYDAVAADTAKYHLMINFHGASLPTGLQRTWPNVMSYEAVRGAENGIEPSRSLTVPFTRNVVGSMDWTPITFSRGNGNSSKAQEVAMGIVYESGWQHASDKPESYAAEPNAERFLQNLPAQWAQTRLLSGDPASNIVLARRHDDRWYVGGMRAGTGSALSLPLSQLGTGDVLVDLLTDDGSNGSATLLRTERRSSSDTLQIPTATNGGFAAVVCAAEAGRQTCLEPAAPWAAVDLTVDPAQVDAAAGKSVRIAASFSVAADASGLSMAPVVPAGWTVAEEPVSAASLPASGKLNGSWTVTIPADAPSALVEIPVVASYTAQGQERSASGQATVWVAPPALDGKKYISDLEWMSESNGYGPVERDQSNGQAARGDGGPIRIQGTEYAKGVGMHAPGELTTWLGGTCTAFSAKVGIDDEVLDTPGEIGVGSVVFEVIGDGNVLGRTGVVTNSDGAVPLNVDVTGVKKLTLRAGESTDGKNYDHADWADAQVECSDPGPVTPSLTLGATTIVRGSSVTVRGAGFEPGSEITLELHSQPMTIGSATADEGGAFETSVVIPATAEIADHEVVARTADGVEVRAALRVTGAPTPDPGTGGGDGSGTDGGAGNGTGNGNSAGNGTSNGTGAGGSVTASDAGRLASTGGELLVGGIVASLMLLAAGVMLRFSRRRATH